jgi:hypothetical protein
VCVSAALPSLEVVCEEAFSEDEGGDDMALREVCGARERGGYLRGGECDAECDADYISLRCQDANIGREVSRDGASVAAYA